MMNEPTDAEATGSGWLRECCYCLIVGRFAYTERVPNSARPFMGSIHNGTLGAFFAMCLAMPAIAQDDLRLCQPAPSAATLTGEERLCRKWVGEHRVDEW